MARRRQSWYVAVQQSLAGAALVLPSTGRKIWRQRCRKPISRKPKPSRCCQDLRSRSFIAARRPEMPSSFRLTCWRSRPSRHLEIFCKPQIRFCCGCVWQRPLGRLGSGLFRFRRREAPSAGFPRQRKLPPLRPPQSATRMTALTCRASVRGAHASRHRAPAGAPSEDPHPLPHAASHNLPRDLPWKLLRRSALPQTAPPDCTPCRGRSLGRYCEEFRSEAIQ
jgi:hypothetical protein